MKKTRLLIFAAVIAASFITQQASAKIWRVNNRAIYDGSTHFGENLGGTSAYPVFAQIQQALDWGGGNLVVAGDTLYIEASPTIYDAVTIERSLTIIGTGYFLSQNPHVSSTTDSSYIGSISFESGSQGSQLIGMSVVHEYPYNINLNTNNLTVKRCWIADQIEIEGTGLSDINILENFFSNTNNQGALNLTYPYNYPSDLVFNNNICKKTLIWGGSILQCNNNVFDGPVNELNLEFTTSEFKNNILKPLNATVNINNGNDLNVSYNIGTSDAQFGTENYNITVVTINTLFVSSSSPDGMYQIADGSAADNSGSDGTDRGAFGGAAVTSRYTLSGLAAIPVIYEITTPGATATNLPVTIQARTIK